MSRIFLSYRRQDAAGAAGRIYDRLRQHFGADAVIMDIDSIPFGVDFRQYINAEVAQCDVLVAVIGPNWAGTTWFRRRLDDPRDFVRIEIEAALQREIPVIPVLIDRAPMPGEAKLPPSLAPLAYRNAIEVDQGRDCHPHIDRLIRGIERLLQQPKPAPAAPSAQPEKPAAIIPEARDHGRKPEPLDAAQRAGPPAAREPQPDRPPSTADPRPQPKTQLPGADGSTSEVQAMPDGAVKSEPRSNPSPAASRSPEPAVWSQLPGTPPKRRHVPWLWIYLAALPLLAVLGIVIHIVINTSEPEFLTTRVGQIKLKRIPSGTFLMGSPEGRGASDEHPQHVVRITRPFYLGVTEATQGQYRAITGENPSFFKWSEDLPVEQVSWKDAIAFCNTLSRKEGLPEFYRIEGKNVVIPDWRCPGYRLPTEAEWEYACRAGSTTRYSFGDDVASLGEYAWYYGNSAGKTQHVEIIPHKTLRNEKPTIAAETHPVGQKRPNPWGLYDMYGNVEEWCWDLYDPNYYGQSPGVDPLGPPKGLADDLPKGAVEEDASLKLSSYGERVQRGLSWFSFLADVGSSAARNHRSAWFAWKEYGFRVARNPSSR
jgi:formylglycine-generating enzyme required for sulfatase activity